MKNNTSNIIHNTSRQLKLSIIVPIYNVAPYLRKCVDSLLAQDYDDYEIILVDDGSPDSCPQICDEYVKKAKSGKLRAKSGADVPLTSDIQHQTSGVITVIHRENGGLSAARNSGIEVARGEYLMFVDSDDYLEPNVLGALMAQIERDNLDVLRFRYQNVKESGEAFAPYKDMTNYNDYSVSPTDGLTFLNERMGIQCYAWQFVVKADIVRQELFTPGIYFEDTDWTPRMLLRAERVASTELVVYNYLWREGSITLSQKDISKMRKQLDDKIAILGRLNEGGKQVSNRRWFDSMISGLVINVVGIIASTFYSERKAYIRQIKALDILPITTYHIAPRAQRKVKLINLSPALAVLILRLKIRS
jgi:glycosyltransferase involved in cell wall biosynthesis